MVLRKLASWSEIESARNKAWAKGKRDQAKLLCESARSVNVEMDIDQALLLIEELGVPSNIAKETCYGVWINHCDNKADLDWFGEFPLEYQDKLYLPAKHNLAVDTGLHLTSQKTFVKPDGSALTTLDGITDLDGVRFGGVDNNTSSVTASTNQFDTTGSNRFIVAWDADPTYSAAAKRMTALFTIDDGDTTITHARYGLTTDSANSSNSLFSMLGGFSLDFGGNAYSITIESQTDYTGS